MIVPSMSYDEIINQVRKDLPLAESKLSHLITSMRRPFIKGKKEELVTSIDQVSKNKNKWTLIVRYRKKQQIGMLFCQYLTEYGFNCVVYDSFDDVYIFFTPHFFRRYNERFLQNLQMEKKELALQFILRNQNIGTTTDIDTHEMWACSDDGVILGQDVGNKRIYKTFITYEQLREPQYSLIERALRAKFKSEQLMNIK